MREEQPEWNIAVCGLNCARCPIYQAYHSQDNEFQRRSSRGICGSVASILRIRSNAMVAVVILNCIGLPSAHSNPAQLKKGILTVLSVMISLAISWQSLPRAFHTTDEPSRT